MKLRVETLDGKSPDNCSDLQFIGAVCETMLIVEWMILVDPKMLGTHQTPGISTRKKEVGPGTSSPD